MDLKLGPGCMIIPFSKVCQEITIQWFKSNKTRFCRNINILNSKKKKKTSFVFLNDFEANIGFHVLSQRSHGCSSQAMGSLEFMLHRRPAQSDGNLKKKHFFNLLKLFISSTGLGPTDNDPTTLKDDIFYVVLNQNRLANRLRHRLQYELQFSSANNIYFGSKKMQKEDISNWIDDFNLQWSFLGNNELPQQLHLMTLQQYNESENLLLVQIAHLFEVEEDKELSVPTTFNLTSLLSTYLEIKSVWPTSLTALYDVNQLAKTRLKWETLEDVIPNYDNDNHKSDPLISADTFTVYPGQISTFLVSIWT